MPAGTLQIRKCALNGEDCRAIHFFVDGWEGQGGKKEELLFGKCPLFPNAQSRHCWVKHLVYQGSRGPRERPAPCLKTGTSDFGMGAGERGGPLGRGPY